MVRAEGTKLWVRHTHSSPSLLLRALGAARGSFWNRGESLLHLKCGLVGGGGGVSCTVQPDQTGVKDAQSWESRPGRFHLSDSEEPRCLAQLSLP